jgi:hypothetical protein
MNKLFVVVGIIVLIFSVLIIISMLLGVSTPPGYLSANAIWLLVGGITLILWVWLLNKVSEIKSPDFQVYMKTKIKPRFGSNPGATVLLRHLCVLVFSEDLDSSYWTGEVFRFFLV